MPFVLEGLGATGAGMLLVLACIAGVYLIKALGAALPKLNLRVVTLDLGHVFDSIANPAISWITRVGAPLFAPLLAIFFGFAYLFEHIFGSTRDALSHHASQIQHLNNTVIPNAVKQAEAESKQYAASGVTTVAQRVTTATTTIERISTADEAKAIDAAKTLVHTIDGDLTRSIAHAVTVAKDYVDSVPQAIRDYIDGEVRSIPAPVAPTIPGDILGLPALVAGLGITIAGVQAAVQSLAYEQENCNVTSCEGPNNLSSLLQTLLGGVDLATIAAFLAYIIDNPAAAEAQYAGVFAGLVSGAVTAGGDVGSELEQLLGL